MLAPIWKRLPLIADRPTLAVFGSADAYLPARLAEAGGLDDAKRAVTADELLDLGDGCLLGGQAQQFQDFQAGVGRQESPLDVGVTVP